MVTLRSLTLAQGVQALSRKQQEVEGVHQGGVSDVDLTSLHLQRPEHKA